MVGVLRTEHEHEIVLDTHDARRTYPCDLPRLLDRVFLHGHDVPDLVDREPEAVALEEVSVNKNPQPTLKLGQARGVALLCAARGGLDVGEYAARLVKKAVVGNGNAEKAQVHAMVQRLLPGAEIAGPDAADALAVAITHAHHLASARRLHIPG
jgi:crossover junction endodeoxyribonuclease RuvC